MASTFGLTLQEWQRRYQQDPHCIGALLTAHLDAIDRQDNAWLCLATPAQLQAQIEPLLASYLRNPAALPLFGVPFAVKDNIDVAGWPTSAACPAFTYTAQADAFVVARLKAAGAVVIGKTNLDQFATGLVGTRSPYGAVSNTFNPAYVSGGSSSGSLRCWRAAWSASRSAPIPPAPAACRRALTISSGLSPPKAGSPPAAWCPPAALTTPSPCLP